MPSVVAVGGKERSWIRISFFFCRGVPDFLRAWMCRGWRGCEGLIQLIVLCAAVGRSRAEENGRKWKTAKEKDEKNETRNEKEKRNDACDNEARDGWRGLEGGHTKTFILRSIRSIQSSSSHPKPIHGRLARQGRTHRSDSPAEGSRSPVAR